MTAADSTQGSNGSGRRGRGAQGDRCVLLGAHNRARADRQQGSSTHETRWARADRQQGSSTHETARTRPGALPVHSIVRATRRCGALASRCPPVACRSGAHCRQRPGAAGQWQVRSAGVPLPAACRSGAHCRQRPGAAGQWCRGASGAGQRCRAASAVLPGWGAAGRWPGRGRRFRTATSRGRESALMDVLMSKSPWSPEANFENACLRGVPNAKRRGEFVEKVSGEKTSRHGGAEASGGQRQEKTDRRTLPKSRATHRTRSATGVYVMKNLKSSNHKP